MNISERLKQLPPQQRAYITGTLEFIQNEWMIFDEHDEPISFNDYKGQMFEIWQNASWTSFHEFDDGMALGRTSYVLKEGDKIRIQKPLPFVYQEWLNELSDLLLTQFVSVINAFGYSVFDCIYCHNYLFFQTSNKPFSGVNFIILDNEDQVCNIQHHFCRNDQHSDRFEMTLNNGERKLFTML